MNVTQIIVERETTAKSIQIAQAEMYLLSAFQQRNATATFL